MVQTAALALARRLGAGLVAEHGVVAVLLAGSMARGQALAGADVDLIAILDAAVAGPEVTSLCVDGVQVDIDWMTRGEALARTQGIGWTWELRRAARLGHAVAVYDPDGLAPMLAARAIAMRPDSVQFEDVLGDVYATLAALGQGSGSAWGRSEMGRAIVDSVALLTLLASPGRYQKPKWVMPDLHKLGEAGLLRALHAAYGLGLSNTKVLEAVGAFVDAILDSRGAPPRDCLMGYAPDFPGEGLLARTYADALDLAVAGRQQEALFVARFAARTGATLLADGLAAQPGLADRYQQIFAEVPVLSRASLGTALEAADRCATRLESWNSAEVLT